MTCNNCGFDSEQNFNFCPVCGATGQPEQAPQNPAAQAVLCALKDKLFLLICILVSASCILSLAADSVPLLGILATVFLWLIFAKSRSDMVDVSNLRCVSGTIYAQYVITNVVGILFVVIGGLCLVLFDELVSIPGIVNAITAEIGSDLLPITELTGTIFGTVFAFVFILLGALVLVLNIFSMRYIHRFAKSLYQSVQRGVLQLKYIKAAQVWLFIFGGFSGFSVLTSLFSGELLIILTNGVSCALYITAGLLVRNHFTPKEELF